MQTFQRKSRWVTPTLPVGVVFKPVRRAFLSQKLRRLSRRLAKRVGCRLLPDVKEDNRPGSSGSFEKRQPEAETPCLNKRDRGKEKLTKEKTCCSGSPRLGRKARAIVKFLKTDRGLKPVNSLPRLILCGQLRTAVRSVYPSTLPVVDELSLKTVQKVEGRPCKFCQLQDARRLESWKEARFSPIAVLTRHLEEFKRVVAINVPQGWNKKKYPFIPDGAATFATSRKAGGNWRRETLHNVCRAELVYSAGKPRVVTLFSEGHTRTLTSAHQALYGALSRKGWLLVGDPTPERVASLNGYEYVSVDYSSATDNIKTAYSKVAIEALKERAEGMSEDEVRALETLYDWRLLGRESELVTRGQPMGSVLSFPLLCLINKAVFDMALTDLCRSGEVSVKEWRSHRCLINGDDLLFREPTAGSGRLLSRIRFHGHKVGLVINEEKTMSDIERGEINSTVFREGVLEKKTNAAALFMAESEADVLGFAERSTVSVAGFRKVVRRNWKLLAGQDQKLRNPMRSDLYPVILGDRLIRKALRALPLSGKDQAANPFPVVTKPAGYRLTRAEECEAIEAEVDRLRSRDYVAPVKLRSRAKDWKEDAQSVGRALRQTKHQAEEDLCLLVLAKAWELKEKQRLLAEDPTEVTEGLAPLVLRSSGTCTVMADGSEEMLASRLVKAIRSERTRATPTAEQRRLASVSTPEWIPL